MKKDEMGQLSLFDMDVPEEKPVKTPKEAPKEAVRETVVEKTPNEEQSEDIFQENTSNSADNSINQIAEEKMVEETPREVSKVRKEVPKKKDVSNDERFQEELGSVKEFAMTVLDRINAISASRGKQPLDYGLKHEIAILQHSCEEYSYIRIKLLERIAEKMEVSMPRLLGERPRYEEQPKGYAVFEGKLYRIYSLDDLKHFLKICDKQLGKRETQEDERPIYIRRIEELCTNRQQMLDKMHISSARYSTILHKTPNLTLPMVKRFADALNVSIIELFQESEKEDFLATITCKLKDNVRMVTRTFTQYDKLLEHSKEIERTIAEMKR